MAQTSFHLFYFLSFSNCSCSTVVKKLSKLYHAFANERANQFSEFIAFWIFHRLLFLCTKRMDDKTKIFSVAFPSAKRYRLIGGSQNFLPLFFFSFFLSFSSFCVFIQFTQQDSKCFYWNRRRNKTFRTSQLP